MQPDTLAVLWEQVDEFARTVRASGVWMDRRRHQSVEWMRSLVAEELEQRFARHPLVRDMLPRIQAEVENQSLPAASAARKVLDVFFSATHAP